MQIGSLPKCNTLHHPAQSPRPAVLIPRLRQSLIAPHTRWIVGHLGTGGSLATFRAPQAVSDRIQRHGSAKLVHKHTYRDKGQMPAGAAGFDPPPHPFAKTFHLGRGLGLDAPGQGLLLAPPSGSPTKCPHQPHGGDASGLSGHGWQRVAPGMLGPLAGLDCGQASRVCARVRA